MSSTLYEHASQSMRQGSKSFASASRLFDATTRRSTLMLYSWCRHCDDVIDGQALGSTPEPLTPGEACAKLQMLESQTRQAYAGVALSEPAFAAFQEVALRHDIPAALAFAHLEGFAMDVRHQQYETLDDTLRYCYHVAGVVGLMMAHVMGVRCPRVLDRACDLGLAFQLTNIARDIVDDAQAGRCYLPREWLQEEGLTPETLAAVEHRPALSRLACRLVATAEPYYASARMGLQGLPLRAAWAIAAAHGVYREIGVKVRLAGEHAWDRRQGTRKSEKLVLVLSGAAHALSSRVKPVVPRDPQLWQRPDHLLVAHAA
ncbi:phytoene synthase [Enterobacterales bacterium CwR94]|nr:phytoene synthase [Enterobacterales bacterium CwR94]